MKVGDLVKDSYSETRGVILFEDKRVDGLWLRVAWFQPPGGQRLTTTASWYPWYPMKHLELINESG